MPPSHRIRICWDGLWHKFYIVSIQGLLPKPVGARSTCEGAVGEAGGRRSWNSTHRHTPVVENHGAKKEQNMVCNNIIQYVLYLGMITMGTHGNNMGTYMVRYVHNMVCNDVLYSNAISSAFLGWPPLTPPHQPLGMFPRLRPAALRSKICWGSWWCFCRRELSRSKICRKIIRCLQKDIWSKGKIMVGYHESIQKHTKAVHLCR